MLNARDVPLANAGAQPLHCDTDGGVVPDARGYFACTVVWMLDRFSRENGAPRLVPGTHRSGRVPREAVADVAAPHPDEIKIEGGPGDVLVFNGHCWHGGAPNRTGRPAGRCWGTSCAPTFPAPRPASSTSRRPRVEASTSWIWSSWG